jgi:CheY-like chemotaxis protein
MKNKKVLIVEDSLIGRRLLGFLLNKWGLIGVECANGKIALEKLRSEQFDLILMDIQMPELNGYETSKQIRFVLKSSLPIIAITAHSTDTERKNCFLAGINEYICKPIIEDDLHLLITKHLAKPITEGTNNEQRSSQ